MAETPFTPPISRRTVMVGGTLIIGDPFGRGLTEAQINAMDEHARAETIAQVEASLREPSPYERWVASGDDRTFEEYLLDPGGVPSRFSPCFGA